MVCTRNWTDQELKVAQEWIRRDSRALPLGRHCACPPACYRRSNLMAVYLCFTFCGLVVFTFGIYVGYVFVRPYRLSLGFANATCVTSRFELDLDAAWRPCTCGWWCRSQYPCLRLYVNVTSAAADSVTSLLHDSELYMGGECTFEPECQRDKTANHLAVEEYKSEMGEYGNAFHCLYDPYNPYSVITSQRSDPWWVLHLLLWPNVVTLCFFIAVFITCLTCGHRYVCSASPPEEISQEATRRVGHPLGRLEQLEEGRPLRNSGDSDCYSAINAEPC